jgi:sugar O-acyltransferase (sialic acid O-acetyltransferase NeuD family)
MPRDVVVFGDTPFASLARYCLVEDGKRRVAGFTVHRDYLREATRDGLPVVAFEALEERFPPERCELLIAAGPRNINGLREDCFASGKRRGYRFATFLSTRASLWPNVEVGEGCMVFEHAILQPYSRIGNNVVVRSGAHVSHHCEVADHAFIAAEAAMGGETRIGERAFIGVGAVLRDKLKIAPRSLVGAGAVVVADTEADGVYVGNPARRIPKSAAAASSR